MSEDPTDQFAAWDAELRAALAGIYLEQADTVAARVIEQARGRRPSDVPSSASSTSSD